MALLLGQCSAARPVKTYCKMSTALASHAAPTNLQPKPPPFTEPAIEIQPKFDSGYDVPMTICQPEPQKRSDAVMNLKLGFRRFRPRCKVGDRTPATARGSANPLLNTFRQKVEPFSKTALTARSNPGHSARVNKPPRNLLALPAHYIPRPPANKNTILEFALGGVRHVPLPTDELTNEMLPKLEFPEWFLPKVAEHELNNGLKFTVNQFGETTKSVAATEILGKLNSARDVVSQARQEIVFKSKSKREVNVRKICMDCPAVGRCCPCCSPLRHKQMLKRSAQQN